jgi:hypothetical protein
MPISSQEVACAESIAQQIADYRSGAIAAPDAAHVLKWSKQLDPSLRAAALAELDHVLKSTYFSAKRITEFLQGLASHPKFTDGDPTTFWKSAQLLNIQLRGASQSDLNKLLVKAVKAECGVTPSVGSAGKGPFIYLDDAIFTGNHVRRDIEAWVNSSAPEKGDVHVVVLALHKGSYYHRGKLEEAIKISGKAIKLHWWRCLQLEDRKKYINQSDVLRPRSCPADEAVKAYIDSLSYDVEFRAQDGIGNAKLFSAESGRHALEQALLIAGVKARTACPSLPPQHRPLGYHALEMLGFGSMIVTYRNCPNNAPIALWAGDPWYPLLPRRTN